MSYTILLMDADETLLDFRRSEGFALEHTLQSCGVAMTPAIHDAYHEINRVLWQQLERGEIARSALRTLRFERLFAQIGLQGVDADAFNTAYMQTLGGTGFLLPGALELLRDLHARFKVYLITNGTASVQHTRLAHSGMLPFLHGVFISEEVGADKPSERFFEHVLSSIGSPDKREVLVIGDSLTSDVEGGRRMGLDTCWYAPDPAASANGIEPMYRVASFDELRSLLAV